MEPKISAQQALLNQVTAVSLDAKVSEDEAILSGSASGVNKTNSEYVPNYTEQRSYCSDTRFSPGKKPNSRKWQNKLCLKMESAEYDEAGSDASLSKTNKGGEDSYDNCHTFDSNFLMSRQSSSQVTPKPISEKSVCSFITPCETVTPCQAKQASINMPKSIILNQEGLKKKNLLLKQDASYNGHDKHRGADVSFQPHETVSCSSASQVNSMDTEIIFFPRPIKTEPGIEFQESEIPSCSEKQEINGYCDLPPSGIKKERLSPIPSLSSDLNALSFVLNENADNLATDPKSSKPNRRRTGEREMLQLYQNLNEISWAQDKDFAALLHATDGPRHSGRNASNKAMASIKKEPVDSSPKFATKRSPKSKQKIQKPIKKPLPVKSEKNDSVPASIKQEVKKSSKIRARQHKRPLQPEKPLLKSISSRQQVASKDVKTRDASHHLKSEKAEASIKKEVPSLVKPTKAHNKKDIQTNQVKCSKQKKNASAFSEFQNSPELQVKVKPLQNSHPSTSGINTQNKLQKEDGTRKWKTVQETMLKGYATQDPNYLNTVLREVQDSIDSTSTTKTLKKSDEGVRSSLRQSECAFRYKEIVVKKQGGLWQVVLVPNEKKQNCLTIEAIKELKEVFLAAKKDINCRVVLLNSSGKYFCMGIDLTQLYGSNKKHAADEMAVSIKDLFTALSTFFKPVVAAVNGLTAGLGLSLLTYCDIIYANDVASFSIPANHFGYIPEGGVTLTLLHYISGASAAEILLHGRRLNALDAKRVGLVAEVFYPKLMENVVPRIQKLLKNSSQAMETTKMMTRCHMWEKLIVQLENERQVLPSQWLSHECQQKIKERMQIGWLYDC